MIYCTCPCYDEAIAELVKLSRDTCCNDMEICNIGGRHTCIKCGQQNGKYSTNEYFDYRVGTGTSQIRT